MSQNYACSVRIFSRVLHFKTWSCTVTTLRAVFPAGFGVNVHHSSIKERWNSKWKIILFNRKKKKTFFQKYSISSQLTANIWAAWARLACNLLRYPGWAALPFLCCELLAKPTWNKMEEGIRSGICTRLLSISAATVLHSDCKRCTKKKKNGSEGEFRISQHLLCIFLIEVQCLTHHCFAPGRCTFEDVLNCSKFRKFQN